MNIDPTSGNPTPSTERTGPAFAADSSEFLSLVTAGVNTALSAAGFGIPGVGGLSGVAEQANLLRMQNQIQQQALVFTAQSNTSKTAHESKMNSVRNIK